MRRPQPFPVVLGLFASRRLRHHYSDSCVTSAVVHRCQARRKEPGLSRKELVVVEAVPLALFLPKPMLPTKALRSVQPSAALKARVPRESYLRKLAKPEDLVPLCASTSSLPEPRRGRTPQADLPMAGAHLQSRITTTVDGLGAYWLPLEHRRCRWESHRHWPSHSRRER